METIYDWLLHNIGNSGNYYTILNVEREGTDALDIMARSSDFTVINLLINLTYPSNSTASVADGLLNKGQLKKYVFPEEHQVIGFLAEGKTPESQNSDLEKGISIVITAPAGEVGDITFPPTHV